MPAAPSEVPVKPIVPTAYISARNLPALAAESNLPSRRKDTTVSAALTSAFTEASPPLVEEPILSSSNDGAETPSPVSIFTKSSVYTSSEMTLSATPSAAYAPDVPRPTSAKEARQISAAIISNAPVINAIFPNLAILSICSP